MTDYAFNILKLKRIYAGVFGFNTASMAVLEKNGYKKEAILKSKIIKNETIFDEHLYAKLMTEDK
jgi:RimJ/RimL family protein N-acetyltransferase